MILNDFIRGQNKTKNNKKIEDSVDDLICIGERKEEFHHNNVNNLPVLALLSYLEIKTRHFGMQHVVKVI